MANMTPEQIDVMKLREALARIVGTTDSPTTGDLFDITATTKLYEIRRLAQRALDGSKG